jgi:hypothetical protein
MDHKKIAVYVQNVKKKLKRLESLKSPEKDKVGSLSTETNKMNMNNNDKKLGNGGYLIDTEKKVSYKYYNNPNILISRLKLLLASEKAGNDSHNEIESILNELNSNRIIKRCQKKK